MAYVGGFRHDVFVSYAHRDNEDPICDEGWVTEFVRRLRRALPVRLGDGEPPDICFDASLGANQQINQLIDSAAHSAIFLAIGSRSYISREYTLSELAAFAATGARSDRIFVAESLPLLNGGTYPAPIDDHHRLEFHSRLRDDGPSLTIAPQDPRFNGLIHDLAEQMSTTLRQLRGTPVPRAHQHPGLDPQLGVARGPTRTVLLAETTDDQDKQRRELRRHLEQYGVTVLPTEPYPQGGRDFAESVEEDAGQAAIFVQLLGEIPGRRPRDLPAGYARCQADIATAKGLEICQWRPLDLSLDAVEDEDHRRLLTGENVRAEGFEAFKRFVTDRATTPPPVERTRQLSLAFINTDQKDLDFARRVQEEFARSEITVSLPTFRDQSDENRADLENNLIECQALLFIYASSTPEWVRRQLRQFAKIRPRREEPPRMMALCLGPPPEKDDIAMAVPGLRTVDCRSLDMSAMRTLITEITL